MGHSQQGYPLFSGVFGCTVSDWVINTITLLPPSRHRSAGGSTASAPFSQSAVSNPCACMRLLETVVITRRLPACHLQRVAAVRKQPGCVKRCPLSVRSQQARFKAACHRLRYPGVLRPELAQSEAGARSPERGERFQLRHVLAAHACISVTLPWLALQCCRSHQHAAVLLQGYTVLNIGAQPAGHLVGCLEAQHTHTQLAVAAAACPA
jgi:hypothetical protein